MTPEVFDQLPTRAELRLSTDEQLLIRVGRSTDDDDLKLAVISNPSSPAWLRLELHRNGSLRVKNAVEQMIRVAAESGDLRAAEWAEDFDRYTYANQVAEARTNTVALHASEQADKPAPIITKYFH